jgi:uncharacterized membrane protein YadS
MNDASPALRHVPWLPGLLLAVAVAAAARFLARFTGAIPDVLLALIGGIAIANLFTLPAMVQPGVRFVLHTVLRTAIILLGAGLTVAAIVGLGGATLGLVVICVCVAMSLGLLLARVARLTGTIGTLIGAGTAICGGTAILAIGPLIGAADEEIAYAVTTIFTFNIIALLVYPPLGHALHLSSVAFGSWAGTAVNDTSVVVATGYVYDPAAGATATIVKLTRTLLLVPLAVIAAAHRRGRPVVHPRFRRAGAPQQRRTHPGGRRARAHVACGVLDRDRPCGRRSQRRFREDRAARDAAAGRGFAARGNDGGDQPRVRDDLPDRRALTLSTITAIGYGSFLGRRGSTKAPISLHILTVGARRGAAFCVRAG